MKLLSLFALFALTTTSAHAAYVGPNSIEGAVKGDVQAVIAAADDTKMILEGKLINQVSKEKYTFQDGTGEIIADIDSKEFREITVNENTKVRLIGKIDKDFGKDIEFDVKAIEIIQ